MANRDKIRVGIIGVGWGALVQTPAFRAIENFEVVALCGRRPERAEAAGERTGITDISTDWKDFIKRDDLDLISVASPVDLHVEMSLAALNAGKHVLCEKPAALDASAARDLWQGAEQTDKATAMCFEMPWTPHKLAIWDFVKEGALGDPYFIRTCQSAGYWHPTHKPQSEWMYKRSEGGGYLMGQQSHEIDFVSKVFGEPVAVCADVKTSVPKREMPDGRVIDVDADDTGNVLLRLDSGASVVLTSSVVGLHTQGQTFDAFGSKGSVVLGSDSTLKVGRPDEDGLIALPPSSRQPKSGVDLGTRRSAGPIRAMALMLEDWLPAFDGKPTPGVPTWRDGWRVQRVIDAARESSNGAGWIELENA